MKLAIITGKGKVYVIAGSLQDVLPSKHPEGDKKLVNMIMKKMIEVYKESGYSVEIEGDATRERDTQ